LNRLPGERPSVIALQAQKTLTGKQAPLKKSRVNRNSQYLVTCVDGPLLPTMTCPSTDNEANSFKLKSPDKFSGNSGY
jgi:hypothetical protein